MSCVFTGSDMLKFLWIILIVFWFGRVHPPLLSPPTPVTNWRLPAASQTPAKHPIRQLPELWLLQHSFQIQIRLFNRFYITFQALFNSQANRQSPAAGFFKFFASLSFIFFFLRSLYIFPSNHLFLFPVFGILMSMII